MKWITAIVFALVSGTCYAASAPVGKCTGLNQRCAIEVHGVNEAVSEMFNNNFGCNPKTGRWRVSAARVLAQNECRSRGLR
jgi:hypothetical protein